LTEFEKRYRMTSERFAADFSAGELGDDAEWESERDAYREAEQQREPSDGIEP
jgi:hypothetical protein